MIWQQLSHTLTLKIQDDLTIAILNFLHRKCEMRMIAVILYVYCDPWSLRVAKKNKLKKLSQQTKTEQGAIGKNEQSKQVKTLKLAASLISVF